MSSFTILKCPVCLNKCEADFVSENTVKLIPMLTIAECNHHLCAACLYSIANNYEITCPTCRSVSSSNRINGTIVSDGKVTLLNITLAELLTSNGQEFLQSYYSTAVVNDNDTINKISTLDLELQELKIKKNFAVIELEKITAQKNKADNEFQELKRTFNKNIIDMTLMTLDIMKESRKLESIHVQIKNLKNEVEKLTNIKTSLDLEIDNKKIRLNEYNSDVNSILEDIIIARNDFNDISNKKHEEEAKLANLKSETATYEMKVKSVQNQLKYSHKKYDLLIKANMELVSVMKDNDQPGTFIFDDTLQNIDDKQMEVDYIQSNLKSILKRLSKFDTSNRNDEEQSDDDDDQPSCSKRIKTN
ncbi:cg30-2 [Spodoptera litura granulovirus]|uniref:Cg30-2 n=1 Tax=Spodoptera litura granulovirus TaxID=359919 RepID=A5IZX6_9BBAC|nr:cg30-2 [Spodoptera litura granulovirus]ABQ52067.1 cg30-2 [Spodoptera litura granulovirus]